MTVFISQHWPESKRPKVIFCDNILERAESFICTRLQAVQRQGIRWCIYYYPWIFLWILQGRNAGGWDGAVMVRISDLIQQLTTVWPGAGITRQQLQIQAGIVSLFSSVYHHGNSRPGLILSRLRSAYQIPTSTDQSVPSEGSCWCLLNFVMKAPVGFDVCFV